MPYENDLLNQFYPVYLLQKSPYRAWTDAEDKHLVEYVSIHHCTETGTSKWPAYDPPHPFWADTAKHLAEKTGEDIRQGTVLQHNSLQICRKHALIFFYKRFKVKRS